MSIPAHEAKSRLIEGNKRFINATSNPGDVSLERRVDTLKNGQHPYAIVLCCSDSRQVPEAIFSAGIGAFRYPRGRKCSGFASAWKY